MIVHALVFLAAASLRESDESMKANVDQAAQHIDDSTEDLGLDHEDFDGENHEDGEDHDEDDMLGVAMSLLEEGLDSMGSNNELIEAAKGHELKDLSPVSLVMLKQGLAKNMDNLAVLQAVFKAVGELHDNETKREEVSKADDNQDVQAWFDHVLSHLELPNTTSENEDSLIEKIVSATEFVNNMLSGKLDDDDDLDIDALDLDKDESHETDKEEKVGKSADPKEKEAPKAAPKAAMSVSADGHVHNEPNLRNEK